MAKSPKIVKEKNIFNHKKIIIKRCARKIELRLNLFYFIDFLSCEQKDKKTKLGFLNLVMTQY